LPLGGAIRWNHRTFTYTNGKSVREVWERYLTKQSGAAETRYWFWRDDATDANRDFHYYTALFDPSGPTREWYFGGNTGDWWAGLITALVERPGSWLPSPRRQDFTWAQNPALNPYIATSDQTLDQGQTFEVKSRTQQTLDAYGNVTETKLFDYGSLATPARTYSYSYLDNSNYTPRYIRNRLISASVSTGGAPTTLVSNSYDGASPNNVTGLREHDTANYGTSFLYRGNPTQTISAGKTLNRVYDITGNVVSSGDGLGHSIQVTAASNSNNAVPGLVRLNGNTSSDQTMQYNGWLGLTGVTAPNGATASFSYYGIARPATTTSPHGAQTTYAYTTNTTTATTNGHWVKTTYDGFGRTIKVETGDGASTKSVVDTEYDSCACSPTGKVKRVSQPYAPGAETLYWTTYNYAGFGNPRATNVPLASPNRGRSPSPSVSCVDRRRQAG
jgi:hypothetical protein